MSTTLPIPTLPIPTRSRWAQVPGALVALAGRGGWRLWWPVLPWLVAAAWARLSIGLFGAVSPEAGVWETSPSGVLLLSGLVAIPVLWWWGARYAVGLGHDRGVVFGVATVVSLALQAVLHLVSLSAALVEHRMVGENGVHVFALEAMNKLGTHGTLWNSSWTWGFFYAAPIMVALVVASAAMARWGAWGLLGVVATPVWLFVTMLLLGFIGNQSIELALQVLLQAIPLVLAWFIFRRVPV